jgi:glutamine synthetase
MPQTSGNAYNVTQFGKFPENLKEATDQMKNSQIAKELFGKSFTDHLVKTREWEWSQYLNHVSDWELKRYFETI